MPQKKPSRAIKLFGTQAPEGKRRELNAGHLSALLDNGGLRNIRYRGVEVLRGIAYLLRDKNWGTYTPLIENLKLKQGESGFIVTYEATAKDAEQSLRYCAKIQGNADGTLSFSADGTPLSDFLTNRTGFVVLHPLEGIAAEAVEVEHVDGRREKRRFPKLISPGQPIFNIRSLKHTVMPGVTASVVMTGEKFEMEDHRNWMDASYKTYVCSLLDPWPYTLPRGKSFTQSVTLQIAGKPTKAGARRKSDMVQVAMGVVKGKMPRIGTGVAMQEAESALTQCDLITAAQPSHLVCQIDGRQSGQALAARAFAELKAATNSPLTLEIILPAKDTAENEIAQIAGALREGGLRPDAVVVTQVHDLKSFQPNTPRPSGPGYEEMARVARKAFPGVTLGGGMLCFFTELNRKPPPQGVFDFITHTVCPIVHAADDLSVMETLQSLPWIIASTRAMIGKTPYHLGPSSIACRDNPYGATVAPNPGNGRVCLAAIDPRQRGIFAVAWSLGLVAAAAQGGLAAMSMGSITGPQGLIYRKAAYAQPGYDGTGAKVYPSYHLLAGLGSVAGAKLINAQSSVPAKVQTLAYQTKAGPVLWLANLTPEKQVAKVSGFMGAACVHTLDESSFDSCVKDIAFLTKRGAQLKKVSNLELAPYAVMRVATD